MEGVGRMTANQVNRILADAGIYYRAFPTPKENDNHRIIKKSVEIINRIIEYRGATKGAGSLPNELLAVKYEEMYQQLENLRESLQRGVEAYTEANKAVNDAENLLDHVFI